jgi:hypothetical protein
MSRNTSSEEQRLLDQRMAELERQAAELYEEWKQVEELRMARDALEAEIRIDRIAQAAVREELEILEAIRATHE